MELQDGHYCFYVDETMHVEGKGFRPSIIIEGKPGHYPSGGGDVEPWYWGHEIEKARAIAWERNQRLGLTSDDVQRILASSFTM